MRMHVNPASPFARKARIVARESKTLERLQEIETAVSPVAPNSDLAAANPLIKIPALILDDGTTLYDSRVICEYLDSLMEDPHLADIGFFQMLQHPTEGPVRNMRLPNKTSFEARAEVVGAPKLGQHSVEVLREAGLSESEVGALIENGGIVDGRLQR